MKILNTLKIVIVTISLVLVYSCSIEDGKDLNGPQTSSIADGVSRAELPQVVSGILSDMRDRLGTQVDAVSVLGRDYWRHQSSDPRWVGDLLVGNVDDNTFYTTAPYASRYAVVKECNLLLEGLANTTADFTAEEIAAITGFTNTIKAHELLTVLNLQYQNGIRTDVSDPDNLGAFESYDDALSTIVDLFENAASELTFAAGLDLSTIFQLSSGYDDLRKIDGGSGELLPPTAADFLEFNRALTARAAAYQGDYTLVLSALADSFMDLAGDLNTGAYHQFSATGADILNPLFFALNSTGANARIAHPDFIASAEPGDIRLNKAVFRELLNPDTGIVEPNPLTISDLAGTHDVYIYQSTLDPVGIIRNEELILLYAEANHISNPAEAILAIDIIRAAAGLPPYLGGLLPDDLLNEILMQRRYSLYGEGHRWVDMRRFGRLDELILDRPGDAIVDQFPRPQNEAE